MALDMARSPVLCAKDASLLISKRSSLPHQIFLSVKGQISCMGEKMRVKNDDFFLIELGYGVFILVKDFHLDWHHKLVPNNIVVFYDLRLTTIEKGISKPQSTLVVCRHSRILQVHHNEDMACSTLEEWMSTMKLTKPLNLSGICVDHDEDGCNTLSYNGKVTSVIEADDGIYELDNSIRLFTWLNPSILGDSCFQIGLPIQVFNAHEVENIESVEGKTLICCARTLVRTFVDPGVRAEKITSKDSVMKHQSSSCTLKDLKMTISKYRLNYPEVESLLHLRDNLKDRTRIELIYLLHILSKSLCQGNMPNENISILDMFLQHKEFCPFVNSKISRIKRQMTIAVLEESKDVDVNMNKCDHERGTSNQTWGWCSQEWKNREMLVGSICVEGGQTVFMDQSGKIPVVLTHQWDQRVFHRMASVSHELKDVSNCENTYSHVFHRCSISCKKDIQPSEKLCCPYFDVKNVGRLFLVTNFHLITEYLSNDLGVSEKLTYLLFSLQDCVALEKVTYNSPIDIGFSCDLTRKQHSNGYSNLDKYIVGNDNHIGCYFYVTEKEHLHSIGRNAHFILQGRMLDPSLFSVNGSLEAMNLEEGTMRKAISVDNTNGSKRSGVCGDTTGLQEKKLKTLDFQPSLHPKGNSSVQSLNESLLRSVPVSMHFEKRNSEHFPVIHPGYCYQLTTLEDRHYHADFFQPAFSNEKLGKAVNKSRAKIHISAPAGIKIKEAVYNNPVIKTVKTGIDIEDKQPRVSFAQVLSNELQDSLVSFTAVVHHREIQPSYFTLSKRHTVSSSLNDVRLDLSDVDGYLSGCGTGLMDTISLYFSSSSILYLLGLVPGMVVDVVCVEMKISKKNTVYCKFIPVSSLHVKCFIPQQDQNRLDHNSSNSLNFNQFTREYIRTIWNHGPGDHPSATKSGMWLIDCHICVVFSLKMELVCKTCSSSFVNGGCQSSKCRNTSFDVVVNSVILVEDGTCQAIVKLRKPQLLRKLLTLNDEQWGDVISVLQTMGSIYVSKTVEDSPSTSIGMFLAGLIASPIVIRQIAMLVRVFRDSPCQKTVDNMKEKEFKVKDFRHSKASFKTMYLPYLNLDCVELENR